MRHAELTALAQRLVNERTRHVATKAPNLDAAIVSAITALRLAADEIAKHEKRAEQSRERIQWIETTLGPYVARIGKHTAEYSSNLRRVVVYGADLNVVARLDAKSIESASRRIRAWRKKK